MPARPEPRAEVVRLERVEPTAGSMLEAIPGPAAPTPTVPKAAVRQVSRPSRRAKSAPRGGFARVEPGETLEDVATRVYGSPEAAAELWKSNRDQLPTRETPPRPGMVLRTP